MLKCHVLKVSCVIVSKTGPTCLSNPATFFHFLHNGNIWRIMCYLFCVFTPLEVNVTGTYFITRAAEAHGSLLEVCSECEHRAEWTGTLPAAQTQHLKYCGCHRPESDMGVSCSWAALSFESGTFVTDWHLFSQSILEGRSCNARWG